MSEPPLVARYTQSWASAAELGYPNRAKQEKKIPLMAEKEEKPHQQDKLWVQRGEGDSSPTAQSPPWVLQHPEPPQKKAGHALPHPASTSLGLLAPSPTPILLMPGPQRITNFFGGVNFSTEPAET